MEEIKNTDHEPEENDSMAQELNEEKNIDQEYDRNEDGGRKRHRASPFLKGILAGLGISALLFVLYRGYIDISLPGGYTLTFFLPTYYLSEILGDDEVNYRDVERKLKEVDHYLDTYYYYEKDSEAMEDGAVAGLLYGLSEEDPYVAYFSREDFTDEMESIEGGYRGIGVTITQDEATGGLEVIMVAKDGPAMEAGIQAGDIIVSVDGTDIRGMDMDTITGDYIKGPEETYVEIGVLRDGEELSFTCERRIVENISVHHSMIEAEGTSLGYICISSFENNTDEQFDEALTELEEAGAQGIVLDLRDDLGGAVSSALNILDRIIADDDLRYETEENEAAEKGSLLFYQRDKNDVRRYYYACDGKSCRLPLVILVNENSASASEIVTGVLRDYGYKVVGMNTYGKGIIQSIIQLSDGSAIEFTTAEYILPGGQRIHGVGIAPDVEVEPDEVLLEHGANMDAPDIETDNQLETAVNTLKEEIK